MKKKLVVLLLAIAVIGTYTFGSSGAIFASGDQDTGTTTQATDTTTQATDTTTQTTNSTDAAVQTTTNETSKDNTGGTNTENETTNSSKSESTASNSDTTTTVKQTTTIIDGVTYDWSSGSAIVTKVAAEAKGDANNVLVIPATVKSDEGKEYTVTGFAIDREKSTNTHITKIVFPKTLSSFTGDIYEWSSLKELTIPGSVKVFDGKLSYNTSLETLTFEEGVEKITTNIMTYGDSSLTTINLPDSLTSISDNGVFSGLKALKSIDLPEKLSIDGDSTFSEDTALESIILPKATTKIGNMMFYNCNSLKSVITNGRITTIGNGAFKLCKDLTDASFTGEVTTFGSEAFTQSAITKVDFTSAVTINSYAFYKCTGLKTISFGPNLKDIKASAFSCAWYITDIGKLPDGLETIGDHAFYYCKLGESLTIPDSVKEIGAWAFGTKYANWTQLKTVTIGSGIENVNKYAFYYCDHLEDVTIDASKMFVTLGEEPFNSNTKVTWLSGETDAADSIYSGGPTLQEAINNSSNGDTITIKKNVKLSNAVTVPKGKNVTIKADGNNKIVVDTTKTFSGSIFTVANGATLTIDGGLKVDAKNKMNGNVPAVAVFGTFNLKNGEITNVNVSNQYIGTVCVSDGGNMNMSGGTIDNNKSSDINSSSGIMVYKDGTFHMTGGIIADNTGVQGSAIYLYSTDGNKKATAIIDSGTISNNTSKETVGQVTPTGAVEVRDNAELIMNGGTITGNSVSAAGGQGGGICVDDGHTLGKTYNTTFTMNGGNVSNNYASDSGGGIFIGATNVNLNAGNITGNVAKVHGGGIYCECLPYVLHMTNALITKNTAKQLGGGYWCCPTGDTVISTEGAAIFDNTSNGAGDDFVSVGTKYNGATATMDSTMVGGGVAKWYKDGGVAGNGGFPMQSNGGATSQPRYSSTNPGARVIALNESRGGVALKNLASEGSKALAIANAKLIITDNTSLYGGGVATNGGVSIKGEGTTWNLKVNKTWSGDAAKPDAITIDLSYNGKVIDALTLTKENDYKGTFEGLPSSLKGKIIITEESVLGWKSSVGKINATDNGDESVTITNTISTTPVTPTLTISKTVTKVWNDGNDKNGKRPTSVKVQLYADGKAYGEPVTLTADKTDSNGDWTYVWNNLPKYDSKGNEVSYIAAEASIVKGYDASYSEDSFTITNTYSGSESNKPVTKTVKKVWNDKNNKADKRPKSIKVQLYCNGNEYGNAITLNASNSWKYTWNNLPSVKDGKKQTYTVQEVSKVSGYTTTYSSDTFTITNSITTSGKKHNNSSDNNSGSPDTGDTNCVELWTLLGFTCAMLAGVILIIRRKEEIDNK